MKLVAVIPVVAMLALTACQKNNNYCTTEQAHAYEVTKIKVNNYFESFGFEANNKKRKAVNLSQVSAKASQDAEGNAELEQVVTESITQCQDYLNNYDYYSCVTHDAQGRQVNIPGIQVEKECESIADTSSKIASIKAVKLQKAQAQSKDEVKEEAPEETADSDKENS